MPEYVCLPEATLLAVIAYFDRANGSLKAAHCGDVPCTTAMTTTLDSAGDVGYRPSIAIGVKGLPVISYGGETLKVAHCSDVQCSSATTSTVDSEEWVGDHSSLTIGADGLPLISYYETSSRDLKVLHCGSPFCVPYFRRR